MPLFIVLLLVVFVMRCYYLRDGRLYHEMYRGASGSIKDIQQEFYDLSWNGKDPWRVIRLGHEVVVRDERAHTGERYVHMTSVIYSQVKHALRKGWLPSAITFLFASREFARRAYARWSDKSPQGKRVIELEIIGAPEFFLATLPVIGMFWRKSAASYLIHAWEFMHNDIPDKLEVAKIEHLLIVSKLYRLTQEPRYLQEVRAVKIPQDVDRNQLARIARHVGSKDLTSFIREYVT